MSKKHLIPDVIHYLMSKAINSTNQNEKQVYEEQLKAIRDAINIALERSAMPTKRRA